MTRAEEAALLRLWSSWRPAVIDSNRVYSDFYFRVVRHKPALEHINVYEVLDAVVNAEEEPAPA